MGIFSRKKATDQTINERIDNMEHTISKLKRDVLNTSMDLDSIRDKVLRKIQKRQKEDKDLDSNSIPTDGFDGVRGLVSN